MKAIWRKIKLLLSHFFEINEGEVTSSVTGKMDIKATGGRYILDAQTVNYAFGGLDIFFRLAFEKLNIPGPDTQKALILGFGVGNVAWLLERANQPPGSIIGVEKDQALKEPGRKFFQTHNLQRTTVYYEDAYHHVMKSRESYDLIIVDLFIEGKVPESAEREEFLLKLKEMLNSGGVLIFNRMAHDPSHERESGVFFRYFKTIFPEAGLLPINDNLGIYFRNNKEGQKA